jgi:hypothetical protein
MKFNKNILSMLLTVTKFKKIIVWTIWDVTSSKRQVLFFIMPESILLVKRLQLIF